MSAEAVASFLAGDPEDFLDQYLDSGGFNYLSPLPLDIVRRVCAYLEPHDVRALALTCRRMQSAADSDEVWRHKALGEFWSEANGKPPVAWRLYFRHWWSVSCFWRGTSLEEMSFVYPGKHWVLFAPDKNSFVVCETSNDIRSTRLVKLLKAKTYTLHESNEVALAGGALPLVQHPPVHAWSKHVLAIVDDAEASAVVMLHDITEGRSIAPLPRLADPSPDRPVCVTALLFVGQALVIGHNTGALRAYNIQPLAQPLPVSLHGPTSAHSIKSLSLLDPGRFAALTSAGIRVWNDGHEGFRCTQVIDVAPLALEHFIPSGLTCFVSCAGKSVQTWDLSPSLAISQTLDTAMLLPDAYYALRVLAADEVHAVASTGDSCVLLLRLKPLQFVRRIQFSAGQSVDCVSLDGPIAAVAYRTHCGDGVLIVNVYTAQTLRHLRIDRPESMHLSGKELVLASRWGDVRVWKDRHVLPNKRMRVEQPVLNVHF